MTNPELHNFLEKWFCGCGLPEEANGALLDILEFQSGEDYDPSKFKARDEYFGNKDGLMYLVLYLISKMKLIEHGGSIGGSFLSELGEEVHSALKREQARDGFELLESDRCIHGVLRNAEYIYTENDGVEPMSCEQCNAIRAALEPL